MDFLGRDGALPSRNARFEIIANFARTVDISVYTSGDNGSVDENVDIHLDSPECTIRNGRGCSIEDCGMASRHLSTVDSTKLPSHGAGEAMQ
jgi:hypothetical protein